MPSTAEGGGHRAAAAGARAARGGTEGQKTPRDSSGHGAGLQPALPRDGGPGWRFGRRGRSGRISCLLLSGSGAGGGCRAEGVAGAGAAAPSQSRAGACTDCAQRPGAPLARLPARHTRASRAPRRSLPASQFTERGPAPRRHALPDRAPRGPPLAVGTSPSRSPPRLGPAAAELSRGPGLRASDVPARVSPAANPTQKVPAALRQPARAPAPAIFVNHQLPSERGETERKGGGQNEEGKTPASSPQAASPRSAAVGAPLPARLCCRRLFLFPSAPRPRARRHRLGRNLPGAYRNLLCGVTAFRLNPASSSRPSSRPLRRSRMLARCAAPPPGSWVAAGGRRRPTRTLPAAVLPAFGRGPGPPRRSRARRPGQ
ncbi:uncharacterized protein ACIGJ3_001695 [Trichechus inunguis]